MSYISKNTGAYVNARLTDKGRELLSIGQLNFTTFRLGDSEVDYLTLGSTYDISQQNVLRSKANQPNLKTPILPTPTSTTPSVSVPTLQPIILETVTEAPEKGFFTYNTGATIEYTAQTTFDYVLESETVIPITGMNGTNIVSVIQSPSFVTGGTEPSVGDFMLIKMSNPDISQTNKGVIDLNTPVPYLWYKVQSFTGSVSSNTLTVTVDRNLPDFSASSSSNYAWVSFYPDSDKLFDDGLYSAGTVWNMNNVWSNNMPGIDTSTYESFEFYGSESFVGPKEYYGYTSEISGYCSNNQSISIIHYSNYVNCDNQPEETYGQKFYLDIDEGEAPVLKIPTLMWHLKQFSGSSTGDVIGQTFSGSGMEQYVTLSGTNTEIRYYDLSDDLGNNVGRVFPDLQTFTIDNQEVVAALSYKSNRNWTLPTLEYGLTTNTNGFFSQTQDVYLTYLLASNSGYTTGIPCQNITCVRFSEDDDCPPDSSRKDIDVTFPSGQFPYMNVSGGTGWYADEFYILAQRVPTGTPPNPNGWVLMDYTSDINGHTSGKIDPLNLESTTYTITNSKYGTGTTFNLHDFVNIPQTTEPELLQFGDEKFFFGNVTASGVVTNYRTRFSFNIPPNLWNTSQNPTWGGSGQNVHVSEIGIYDDQNNLVAIGKFITPIEKTNVTTIILEIALDF